MIPIEKSKLLKLLKPKPMAEMNEMTSPVKYKLNLQMSVSLSPMVHVYLALRHLKCFLIDIMPRQYECI